MMVFIKARGRCFLHSGFPSALPIRSPASDRPFFAPILIVTNIENLSKIPTIHTKATLLSVYPHVITGDPKASFTKEEMHAGLHQVYERKLHNQLLQAQRDKPDDKHSNSSGITHTLVVNTRETKNKAKSYKIQGDLLNDDAV